MFVHLWNANESAVEAAFRDLCVRVQSSWQVQVDGEPYLYVGFYHDGRTEDEDWDGRFASQGSAPDVTVMVDVSGRHDGWPQVHAFVLELLRRFRGVATDDEWARLWQREEVSSDRVVDGRHFGAWRSHPEGRSAAG